LQVLKDMFSKAKLYVNEDAMKRKKFLLQAVSAVLSAYPAAQAALAAAPAVGQNAVPSADKKSEKMPTLFIGHGTPMNAILDNAFTRHLVKLGKEMPKPRAIVVVSAHWLTEQTMLTANANPETIYDFGGFPAALYKIRYPSLGDPQLAKQLSVNLQKTGVVLDTKRGLDHGAWTILHHMYPKADIPVIQLGMNAKLSLSEHLELAKQLQALRLQGILIMGSGNIVHNLPLSDETPGVKTFDWVIEFDEMMKQALLKRDLPQLLGQDSSKHPLWRKAHPSIEHYLPLLYALGASSVTDKVTFPFEGYDEASISMRSVRFG
jgi:4,5-DOPA dioxygenase extradiol